MTPRVRSLALFRVERIDDEFGGDWVVTYAGGALLARRSDEASAIAARDEFAGPVEAAIEAAVASAERERDDLNETLDEVTKERDKAQADFAACAEAIDETRTRYVHGRRTKIPNDVDAVVAAIEKAKAAAEESKS